MLFVKEPRHFMPNKIQVEIIYALPSLQKQYQLEVLVNSTILQALEASGIFQDFPELQQQELLLGVWGKRVTMQYVLQPDDRIEIYRPLLIEPKQARQIKVMRERKKIQQTRGS